MTRTPPPLAPYLFAAAIGAVIDAMLDANRPHWLAAVSRRDLPDDSPLFRAVMARVRRRPCGHWQAETFAVARDGQRWFVFGGTGRNPAEACAAAVCEGSEMKGSRPRPLARFERLSEELDAVGFDDAPDAEGELDALARAL